MYDHRIDLCIPTIGTLVGDGGGGGGGGGAGMSDPPTRGAIAREGLYSSDSVTMQTRQESLESTAIYTLLAYHTHQRVYC